MEIPYFDSSVTLLIKRMFYLLRSPSIYHQVGLGCPAFSNRGGMAVPFSWAEVVGSIAMLRVCITAYLLTVQ